MIEITEKRCWLGMEEVEEIYRRVNNDSSKGIRKFRKEVKKVATITRRGYTLFKNEEKLFEVLKEFLPEQLKRRRINCFGELMQYMS